MTLPGALWALVTQGLGGGAVGVAVCAIAGGYAIGGGRRMWARAVCGTVAALLVAGIVATVPAVGGERLALVTPRGAWVSVLVASLLVLFIVATAVPFRKLAKADRAANKRQPVEHGTVRAA